MAQNSATDEPVLNTKWFQIVARRSAGSNDPHYLIHSSDFATVIARTTAGQLLLVRQFRPAVGHLTLELPSGHVEPGEPAEAAARRELLEETGHVADHFELLTTVSPAIGRFTNKMWCYFADNARPTSDPQYQIEAGVNLVLYDAPIASLIQEKEFCSSLCHAALFAAMARGRLNLRP